MCYLISICLASYLSFAQETIFIVTKNHTSFDKHLNIYEFLKFSLKELKNIENFPFLTQNKCLFTFNIFSTLSASFHYAYLLLLRHLVHNTYKIFSMPLDPPVFI